MAYNYNSQQQEGYGAFKDPDQSAPYPSGFPQGDYPPPPHGGYPQQGSYPPPPNGGYPRQGSYPSPPQNGYPLQGGYPTPPQNGYPPPGAYVQVTGDYIDPEYNEGGYMSEFTFSEKTVRMAFIRNVYAILMVQLAVTGGFIALFVLNEDVKLWARANLGLFILAFIISLVTLFALICCPDVRRKPPGNFICLAIFTITEGFLLGFISSFYNAESVLLAVGITTVICLALTLFAFQTKLDFTVMGGALLVGFIVLLLFGILTLFLPRSQFPILHIVYGCCGAFLFSIYLIYDTQLMIGGNHRYSISPEEYIYAALQLYLDVISIFIYILQIVGQRSD